VGDNFFGAATATSVACFFGGAVGAAIANELGGTVLVSGSQLDNLKQLASLADDAKGSNRNQSKRNAVDWNAAR